MSSPAALCFLIDATAVAESDAAGTCAEVGLEFERRRLEATFLLSRQSAEYLSRAGGSELRRIVKSQDVGLCADASHFAPPPADFCGLSFEEGVKRFRSQQTIAYEAVAFVAGRIPTCFSCDFWTPQAFAVLAEWDTRVYLGRDSLITNRHNPFYFCGRLNLANLGPHWIDLADTQTFSGGVATLKHQLDEQSNSDSACRIVCVKVSPARFFQHGIGAMLDGVAGHIQSARQIANRYADISYEHRIPMEQLRAIAEHTKTGELRPFEYEAGYLSAAEQLYLLAAAWDESHRKGKPIRNSTTKSPLGPAAFVETDASVKGISEGQLNDVLGQVLALIREKGQLPPAVQLSEGRLGIQDFLPTLAAGYDRLPQFGDLPLRRGWLDGSAHITPASTQRCWDKPFLPAGFHSPAQLELARLQLWTFKPVLPDA